ncbi:hypothetical protein JP0113_06330 [Helicobacter pylori]|nr:hypothetical protein JP0113_06330 [Helicobacter pylori]
MIQAKEEKDKLEQKCAPYKKLEKLYEVFLEVKGCLNFGFVEKTHSAMDLIASVLSDSKYYLESLYNKASQELSDKGSDKGEKLAELFDLLFEYVKDNKFERLKEPIAYDSTCKKLYPEQNASGKMQRVVLIGYTYDKKQPITLSWIWDHKMGTFIEKCFGFYQVRQVREELEARISELEDENENLAVKISELENSNDQLWQAREKLKTEKTELLREKDNLTKANAELKKENDKLNHQIITLTKEQDRLKQERVQLQDAHGSLKELCANSEKDNQHLTDKLKKLESAQKNLENSNDQLLQAKEKIAKEKTEMERKMALLKSLEATDKSDLDLQNRRFKSTIEDLKRQNRKSEEENIALKERVDGLKEQPSKQPKPQ